MALAIAPIPKANNAVSKPFAESGDKESYYYLDGAKIIAEEKRQNGVVKHEIYYRYGAVSEIILLK